MSEIFNKGSVFSRLCEGFGCRFLFCVISDLWPFVSR
jgi:hypothetical protein